ncbi:MAG: type II toxin-antitoxin system VapC family toxin [Crocosphaera sp.]|nr:type II toxin-antitoxin system VapC family toxin [Crocosphaera sp.]
MNKNTVCLDANFIVLLVSLKDSENVCQQKWQEWQLSNTVIVAPSLIMYEVSNAFHRGVKAGQITQDESESLLETALNLGIHFYGDSNLHQEAFKIANLYNLSATYDAHYLALAQRLEVEFWTADKRLFNAVSQFLSWVKLIKVN